MSTLLGGVLEVFGDCGGCEAARVPLLVVYSSALEERFLGFWYRAIRGQLAGREKQRSLFSLSLSLSLSLSPHTQCFNVL